MKYNYKDNICLALSSENIEVQDSKKKKKKSNSSFKETILSALAEGLLFHPAVVFGPQHVEDDDAAATANEMTSASSTVLSLRNVCQKTSRQLRFQFAPPQKMTCLST